MSVEVKDKQKSNSQNEELITREEIKDTPFHVIGTEQGFFGVIGKHRITEPNEKKEVIEKELKKMTWNRIVQVVMILIEVNK